MITGIVDLAAYRSARVAAETTAASYYFIAQYKRGAGFSFGAGYDDDARVILRENLSLQEAFALLNDAVGGS